LPSPYGIVEIEEAILHVLADWLHAQIGQIKLPDPQLWFKLLNHQLNGPTQAFCVSFERLRRFWELAPHMMEVTAATIIAQYDVRFDAGKTYQLPSNKEDLEKMLIKEVIARVLVRLNHVARPVVNANHSVV
jgi:hypothetical protein